MVSTNHLTSAIILALALAVILPGGQCLAKETGKAVSDVVLTSPTKAPHKTLPGVPPIKYVRERIPQAKVPTINGKYYDALVPDTLDLAERARLVVNTFSQLACPEADYEMYIWPRYFLDPPKVCLQSGSGLCWTKMMEAMPLMRTMSGSKQGLEVDKAWAEDILHQLGPDGLWYLSLKGRPWDNYQGPQLGYPGDQIDVGTDQYAYIAVNGRALGVIALYYQITGDKAWLEAGNKLVDGLDRIAVREDGDKALFKNSCHYPNGLPPAGNGQENCGWNGTGLCQYYRATGYKPALDLARVLVNRYRDNFGPNGEWEGHFHTTTVWLQALTEYACTAHDMEMGRFAQKVYEHGKFKAKGALPSVGFFLTVNYGENCMEPCNVADMTAIAIKLTQAGIGDYWDDADKYIRNSLVESQVTRSDQISDFYQKLKEEPDHVKPEPVAYNELSDRLFERLVGYFSTGINPNDLNANDTMDVCCTGNCARALYYAWENILTYDKGTVNVNLLLNRTSEWADVESYIPYTGRVDIKVKKPCNLRVRMNDWIDTTQVKCTVDGKTRAFKWDGKYVKPGAVKSGQVVTVSFPIYERTEKLTSEGHTYTVIFRGNDVVDMTPRGKYTPLYERSHYRDGQPRYKKAKRFVAQKTAKW